MPRLGSSRRSRIGATLTALIAAAAMGLAGCSQGTSTQSSDEAAVSSGFFSGSAVHSIEVEFEQADYDAMLETYAQTQDKDWIEATVTIDGTTFEQVGLRLKGNSTVRSALQEAGLMSRSTDTDEDTGYGDGEEGDGEANASEPETMPWLIRLDKYVDGQNYEGRSDFVVRGNNTETSMNEAVALAMLRDADVPAQESAFTRFSANGSAETLRLVVDLPDDDLWAADEFGAGTGIVYKADSEGDYSYRGEDATEYEDIFKVKTSGEDDLTPMINFLDFINNSTDEEFEEELPNYLDVQGLPRRDGTA